LIVNTTNFYEKLEKEMDDFVRYSIRFSGFPWHPSDGFEKKVHEKRGREGKHHLIIIYFSHFQ